MTLTVRTRYLALIRAGQKTTTIRAGTCEARAGEPLTFTDYRTSARTQCRAVEHRAVADLSDEDAIADGFSDRRALLAALHAHYPALRADDGVWIVRFALNDSPQSARAAAASDQGCPT